MLSSRNSGTNQHVWFESGDVGGIYMNGKKLIFVLICAALVSSLSFKVQAAVSVTSIPVSTGGYGHSLAIIDDGTLWGWGNNYQYQLCSETRDNLTTPVKIMDDAVSVAAGSMHSLAVKSDGSLFGWGSNTYGQLGLSREGQTSYVNGSIKEYYCDNPVRIMDGVTSIAANGLYSYVIKNDGTLWAFGGNEENREYLIGDGTASQPAPVKVMDNVVLVSAGGSNVLALKADGQLFMWGDNASGEIGDGTTTAHAKPVKVMEDVVTAAQGTFHTLAVKKDGSLWAWGSNYGGGLGDGTNNDSTVPIKIMDDVKSVAAGTCHSLAVKKDGSLWSWGQGVSGLGESKGYNYIPEKILDDVIYASSKQNTNFAVKADGSLWAWGDGINLGNIHSTPIPREAMYKVKTPSFLVKPAVFKVLVNGREMALEAYHINDSDYFKLRDIAMLVNSTVKQFEVGWDGAENAVMLTTNMEYTPVGGELSVLEMPIWKEAVKTFPKIYLEGREIQLASYNICRNNYFKLRDIAKALDFSATLDEKTNTISIDTSKAYD
jgi:alpha-tubulin suppressor-like RCC1 family protein